MISITAKGSTEISKEILPIELNSHFYHIDTSIKEMGIVIPLSKVLLIYKLIFTIAFISVVILTPKYMNPSFAFINSDLIIGDSLSLDLNKALMVSYNLFNNLKTVWIYQFV